MTTSDRSNTNEVTEMWRDVRAASSTKRAANRDHAPTLLKASNIHYIRSNGGTHLIVQDGPNWIDFWPGTGLWHSRDGRKGRGIQKLLNLLQERRHE